MKRIRAAAAIACLAFTIPAPAGPINPPSGVAPTMKTLEQVEPRTPLDDVPSSATAPHAITESGTYYLTRDLIQLGAGNGIEIRADGVTIDLNGFTIRGTPGVSGAGVLAPFLVRHIRIINGEVTGWSADGVSLELSAHTTIDGVFSHDNGRDGVRVGDFAIVRDVHAADNAGSGVTVFSHGLVSTCIVDHNQEHGVIAGHNSIVREVNADTNGGDGINVADGSTVVNCISEINTGALAGGGHGIVAAFGSSISRSVTNSNAAGGIVAGAGAILSGNTAQGNSGDAIVASDGATLNDNTAVGNFAGGIVVGAGATVRGNTAVSNTGIGISAGPGSRVENCTADSNGSNGIQLDTRASAIDCTARDNTFDGVHCFAGASVAGCTLANNGRDGVRATSDRVTIRRCNAESNTGVGFNVDGAGCFVIGNHATANGANFSLAGSSLYGPIVNSATMATNTNPAANYDGS